MAKVLSKMQSSILINYGVYLVQMEPRVHVEAGDYKVCLFGMDSLTVDGDIATVQIKDGVMLIEETERMMKDRIKTEGDYE